jgi:hypothetical protein
MNVLLREHRRGDTCRAVFAGGYFESAKGVL